MAVSSRRVVGGAGIELAVHEAGDPGAPTVVLVHGYPDNAEMWAPVVDRLATRFHVVTYDTRGAGASGAPAGTAGYRLDLLVEDLAAVADATSPDRPIHLAGHDWGSVQAWEAVTTDRMAGRIASYTSMSGPCLDHAGWWIRDRSSLRPRRIRQLAVQAAHSWYIVAFHLPGAPAFWRLGGGRVVHRALVALGELPRDSRPSPTLGRDGANGVRLYRANMFGRAGRPAERRTDVPVQLLVPTGDRFVTPALLDDVGRWVPNLWRRDVPGRHWLPRLHPDRVARWIADLIDHVEPAVAADAAPPGAAPVAAASTGSRSRSDPDADRRVDGPGARRQHAAVTVHDGVAGASEAANDLVPGSAADAGSGAGEDDDRRARAPGDDRVDGARVRRRRVDAVPDEGKVEPVAGAEAMADRVAGARRPHEAGLVQDGGAGPGVVADDVGRAAAAAAGDGVAGEARWVRRWRVEGVDRGDRGRPERPDEGKVVVVTGAGSGIGRQTALAFAERGAEVVAADIDGAAAERTALLCGDLGAAAHAHPVDVGDAEAMEALAKIVERDLCGADVVVNNAGIGLAGGLLDTTTDDWERVLRVNLWGVIHGARLFGQQMTARGEGGHIVNVASAAAFTPSRSYPAYATSKAAVLMLSECLRAELAGDDIGVTAICPGIVDTGIVTATRFVGVSATEQDRRRTRTKRLYALRAFGPERVADAIVGAVEHDRAVVPVAAEARVSRVVSRLAPGLSRRLARLDPTGGPR
ncbi:MAG TPA: SDR family oxidoreductase [Acidimicrobiales bacterium]|nr:SDR family oxidoreductase [Acidimicrobiales bacterium]